MKYRKIERRTMKYPLELKMKVLKDYFDGVDGIRGLERTYGIKHQLILCWIKNCGNPPGSIRPSKETKEACLHLHEPPAFQDPRKELEYLRIPPMLQVFLISDYTLPSFHAAMLKNPASAPRKSAKNLRHLRHQNGPKRIATASARNAEVTARIMSCGIAGTRMIAPYHPFFSSSSFSCRLSTWEQVSQSVTRCSVP